MTAVRLPPGLVLAGGQSRRMGANKALSPFGGQTLLAHVIDRVRAQVSHLALNSSSEWALDFGLPLVADAKPGGCGPLCGILAAMRYAAAIEPRPSHVLTVPLDSPFLPDDLVLRLLAATDGPGSIAIAASGGRAHPVFGLWPVTLADDLDLWLDTPANRGIGDFLARHAPRIVSFPWHRGATGPADPFFNINTPDDLRAAQALLADLRFK